MRSQEFQIQEGDCGDYWGVAGGVADVPAVKVGDKKFVYTPGSPLMPFSEKGPNGRNCTKNPDGEKPTGQWNVIDLYCFGDTSVHVVNDKVTMILYNSRQLQDASEMPLTNGASTPNEPSSVAPARTGSSVTDISSVIATTGGGGSVGVIVRSMSQTARRTVATLAVVRSCKRHLRARFLCERQVDDGLRRFAGRHVVRVAHDADDFDEWSVRRTPMEPFRRARSRSATTDARPFLR